jgi:hypothetical protein
MRRIVFVLGALLALALLAPVSALAQGPLSQIRVMHDSPDAPNVDVFIDGTRAFENVPYSTTTDYQPIAPGKHHIEITATGKSAGDSLANLDVDLSHNKPYTVIALGKLDSIKAQLLADTGKVPQQGHARVRIIDAAADMDPFDVYPSGSTIPVLTDQYFGSADYVNIPAGTYSFTLTPAGSTETTLTSQQLKFEPGWVYSLVVTHPEDKPLIVRASVDRVGSAAAGGTP